MILVTGGAGFIGSTLVKRLNEEGETNILIVDNLKKSDKFKNLIDLKFEDYVAKEDLSAWLGAHSRDLKVIFHQGACTDTLEYDGVYMMSNNFDYSKMLLHVAMDGHIPFIYASSAAVYGHSPVASESPEHEAPLNIYGYSKLIFDQYVRSHAKNLNHSVVGLRYFNVYGSRERYKGKMASMVFHLRNQILETGVAKLFGAAGGCEAGEQTRDFVYVDDLIEMNLYFWRRDPLQTVVNAGTGESRSWNDLANAVIASLGKGHIEYIPFPEDLKSKYQFHTRASTELLLNLGYNRGFTRLEEGVASYLNEPTYR